MIRFERCRRVSRAHPYAVDSVIAVLLFGMSLGSETINPHADPGPFTPSAALLSAAACGPLVFRRRWPRTVLAVVVATVLIHLLHDGLSKALAFPVMLATFTVAVTSDRRIGWTAGGIGAGLLYATAALQYPSSWLEAETIGFLAWTGLATAAGDAVQGRQAYISAVEERAERAERTREEEARRRVAEERLRIARELHDVVAHHIALVNVQAGVAAHVMESSPEQAQQALGHIREAGRSALRELNATVGLLRQSGDARAPKEPAPGLHLLDDLVASFTRTGMPVAVTVEGEGDGDGDGDGGHATRPLPAAVDLTAYRVIQEALTNVHKHADRARAQVRIVYAPSWLRIDVRDDGRAVPATTNTGGTANGSGGAGRKVPGTGHGLIGMHERTAALGGTLRAGPRPEGGFLVEVGLPLPDTTGGP